MIPSTLSAMAGLVLVVTTPLVVIRPILLGPSSNHSALSGPAAIGPVAVTSVNVVTTPGW